MRRTPFRVLAIVCCVLAAGACAYEETDSAATQQSTDSVLADTRIPWAEGSITTSPPVTVALINQRGERVDLALGPGVHAVAMATWCPHSEAFAKVLADPVLAPYLADRRLAFIFETDEWDAVAGQVRSLVESGELSEEQLTGRIRSLKASKGYDGLYDRAKLAQLNGEIYFADETSGLDVSQTPAFYSHRDRVFDRGWTVWLVEDLGVPVELANRLLHQYDPPQG